MSPEASCTMTGTTNLPGQTASPVGQEVWGGPGGPAVLPGTIPSPGPAAGQLAHGVLCRRISSGAHTAVLIRHTQGLHSRRAGLADSLGRAGGKDTHSCCPSARLSPPALIPAVIPLHNRRSVGGRVAPCLPG